jgi:hypothetical protein
MVLHHRANAAIFHAPTESPGIHADDTVLDLMMGIVATR